MRSCAAAQLRPHRLVAALPWLLDPHASSCLVGAKSLLDRFDVAIQRLGRAGRDDLAVMQHSDGRILLVNAQTETLFGYSRDELVGQWVELLVPERFRKKHPGHRAGYFANLKVTGELIHNAYYEVELLRRAMAYHILKSTAAGRFKVTGGRRATMPLAAKTSGVRSFMSN